MKVHEEIAAAMPRMTGLRCTVCGYVRRPAQSQTAGFLAAGWPKCCGQTMYMHTERDPLPPEKQPSASDKRNG